jgi:[ribosomal protein S18]-alanine N-acetyltransferase
MRVQPRIRRAVPADLPGILSIEGASFGRDAYDCKLFAHFLRECGGLFLVVERNRKVCGYMITCIRVTRGHERAELVSVAVDPVHRTRGAASALLDTTLRRLSRRQVERIDLVVRVRNQPARAFYEKYGFRRMGRVKGYYEDGADGIAMSRPVILR